MNEVLPPCENHIRFFIQVARDCTDHTEASKLFKNTLLFPSFDRESKGKLFAGILMCILSNGGNLWFTVKGIPGWGGMRRFCSMRIVLIRDEIPAA